MTKELLVKEKHERETIPSPKGFPFRLRSLARFFEVVMCLQ
jgi:hypothetical protein